jgi:FkbM family methyltransferase
VRFLLVARQKKNVETFQATIAQLVGMGHEVRVAVQEDDPQRDLRLSQDVSSSALTVQSAPTARGDGWRADAPLVRRIRDWLQYLDPAYARADTLRARVVNRVCAEIGAPEGSFGAGQVPGIGAPQVARLRELLAHIEAAIPPDPLHDEAIAAFAPDVVLVTPGVHFGSAQADFIKSARAAGIPVWMLLFSWDNLSTKGALHVAPDLMFVWNDLQRKEAAALHGFPRDRVIVVGAPRFDAFFALEPVLTRDSFFRPLGLDERVPTLLYLCSSRFVAKRELEFVRRWLGAVRAAADPRVRSCNVIVRPHPDIPLLQDDTPEAIRWPDLPNAAGWVSRPFDDDRAIVLRTTYATQQPLYECIFHSTAVVGLNTSAELEAGIIGRPVFTVVADDEAVTGQTNTLHYHYLLKESGGFVSAAPNLDAHVAELTRAVGGEIDVDRIRAFVGSFLRPRGETPVSQVLAKALVKQASRLDRPDATADAGRPTPPRGADKVGVPSRQPAADRTLLRVGYPGSTLRVPAERSARKRRSGGDLLLDPQVVAWLDAYVQPSDVVYDIGAGMGEYALVAAAHRNAMVVAFEPAFAAYHRLCDNIVRNDLRASVVPLPIALADRTALAGLEYRVDGIGDDQYRIVPGVWQRRPFESQPQYVQPACLERLDDVVRRHRLPSPNHLRIRVTRTPEAVVRGALETLRGAAVRSLLLVSPRPEVRPAIEQLLRASGFGTQSVSAAGDEWDGLLFVKEQGAARPAWSLGRWIRARA